MEVEIIVEASKIIAENTEKHALIEIPLPLKVMVATFMEPGKQVTNSIVTGSSKQNFPASGQTNCILSIYTQEY